MTTIIILSMALNFYLSALIIQKTKKNKKIRSKIHKLLKTNDYYIKEHQKSKQALKTTVHYILDNEKRFKNA